MTHTFAELEVSIATWEEIATKLREAGYNHVFVQSDTIDMHGIGLVKLTSREASSEPILCPYDEQQCEKPGCWMEDSSKADQECIRRRAASRESGTQGD